MSNTNASALRILFNAGRRETTDGITAPSVVVEDRGAVAAGGAPRDLPGIDLALVEWRSDAFPFRDFDRFAEAVAADAPGGAFEIRLRGEARRLAPAARQVGTRCQRLAAHRNPASAGEIFERVLASHRRLHDPTRPLAASIHAHALDTWQWLLRLDPEAGLAPQIAALFHDVERLIGRPGASAAHGSDAADAADAAHGSDNADAEHRRRSAAAAGAGLAPMDEQAPHGAWIVDELLAELGLDLAARVRVHRLIAGRRRPPAAADPFAAEIALLDDADALSFFSFDSATYLDDFGPEQTARAVARALARLRPASRAWLRGMRLRTTVARLVQRELARQASLRAAGGFLAAAAGNAGSAMVENGGSAMVENAGSAIVDATLAARPARGGKPSRATAIARSRMAVGLAGGAGIARTRTSALLARAAALGALAVHPASPRASGERPSDR